MKPLLDGDADLLLSQFVRARSFWLEFLWEHEGDGIDALAKALGDAQPQFISECFDGHRGSAKSVMALTCLATLHDGQDGYSRRDYAQRLVKAFEASYVSIEVKGHVLKVAADMFSLNEV